jgi:hypothetical protein
MWKRTLPVAAVYVLSSLVVIGQTPVVPGAPRAPQGDPPWLRQLPVEQREALRALLFRLDRDLEQASAEVPAQPGGGKPQVTSLPLRTFAIDPGLDQAPKTRVASDEGRDHDPVFTTEHWVKLIDDVLADQQTRRGAAIAIARSNLAEWASFGGLPASANAGPGIFDDAVQDQEMESILDEIDPVLVIASTMPSRTAVSARARAWALFTSPFAVVAAAPQDAPRLRFLVTSLGEATGDAFSVRFMNLGGGPVRVPRGSLTVRPLTKAAGDRVVREFQRLRGRATTVKMYGYCLDYLKLPPRAGMVFAVAPDTIQQRNGPVRDILASALALHRRKLIAPEGDPRQYLHSIRQWALWTRERKFTQATFADALIDRAKQNLEVAGRPWTKEIDAFVRGSAVKRWTDVSTVLRLADRVAAARRKA